VNGKKCREESSLGRRTLDESMKGLRVRERRVRGEKKKFPEKGAGTCFPKRKNRKRVQERAYVPDC